MKDLSLEDKNAIRDALSAYCDQLLVTQPCSGKPEWCECRHRFHNLEQQIYQHLR